MCGELKKCRTTCAIGLVQKKHLSFLTEKILIQMSLVVLLRGCFIIFRNAVYETFVIWYKQRLILVQDEAS